MYITFLAFAVILAIQRFLLRATCFLVVFILPVSTRRMKRAAAPPAAVTQNPPLRFRVARATAGFTARRFCFAAPAGKLFLCCGLAWRPFSPE